MGAVRKFVENTDTESQISFDTYGLEETAEQLKRLIRIGKVMAQKYEVVATNPPYAGIGKMDDNLNMYLKDNYFDFKSDLFSAFVVKASQMVITCGFCAFLTPYVWMFIQSYEK